MQNNYLTDYIESKGYTVQECRRPAKKEVPANMRHRYSSYEEYQEALHDFLNGMWYKGLHTILWTFFLHYETLSAWYW